MDKDYTKDYHQEDVFRGLEEAVKTVESPFQRRYMLLVTVRNCASSAANSKEQNLSCILRRPLTGL